jgi:hypothetical protein
MAYNALSEYTNLHGLFPRPWGGLAMAVVIEGTLLFSFITFRRAPRMAGLLLVASAVTTYTLQRWHAEVLSGKTTAMHPLIVAGIVPAAMVLTTWAWHLIREPETTAEDRTERELPPRTLPVEPIGSPALGGRARVLAAERPTEPPDTSGESNGHGSPRQRAMAVLTEQPKLSVPQVAAAARVSERTVRNAKADLTRRAD